jgi:hypothetical protein
MQIICKSCENKLVAFQVFFTHLAMPLGKTSLGKGDVVIAVCKQRLIFTIIICLEWPLVDIGHHWKVFSFAADFLQKHIHFMLCFSFDINPGYQVAALFSVGSMFNPFVFCSHSKSRS